MGLTPRQAATLFFGTSLFGLFSFAAGLLIGIGLSGAPISSGVPNAGAAPKTLAAASPVAAPQSGRAAVLVPIAPAPSVPGDKAPAAAPTQTAAATAPPAGAAPAPPAAAGSGSTTLP